MVGKWKRERDRNNNGYTRFKMDKRNNYIHQHNQLIKINKENIIRVYYCQGMFILGYRYTCGADADANTDVYAHTVI